MAEIELSAISRQCLNRRIGDMKTLAKDVAPREKERNRPKATVQWQFGKTKAREKPHSCYLMIHN